MARAGFYAVESGKISFRRDGNWYSDDERIDNPRIALLFSRSIRHNPDGSYLSAGRRGARLDYGRGHALRGQGDRGRRAKRLYDRAQRRGTRAADPATLEVGPDNVLYCRVKGGTIARALSAQRLLPSEPRLRGRRSRRFLDLRCAAGAIRFCARARRAGTIESSRGRGSTIRAAPSGTRFDHSGVSYRAGAARDSAEHGIDCAPGGGDALAPASGRPARLFARGPLSQTRRTRLLAAGRSADLRGMG